MSAIVTPIEAIDPIASAVRSELAPSFAELRSFMDRRMAELSAELTASVQLASYTEEAVTKRLVEIQETILRLVEIPAANTRNSGIELEGVVQATELAANTILESAEAIQNWVDSGARDPGSLEEVAQRVNAIFEACAFQDVTGQRIRRAIQHLEQVDGLLRELVPAVVPPGRECVQVLTQIATVPNPDTAGPDLAQDEIDRLLNG